MALDVNTAFACLAGTGKHVTVQASRPEHVATLADLAFEVAGGATAFAQRAHAHVETLLAGHFPQHLSAETQSSLRQRFDIRLPEASMRPQNRPQPEPTDPLIKRSA